MSDEESKLKVENVVLLAENVTLRKTVRDYRTEAKRLRELVKASYCEGYRTAEQNTKARISFIIEYYQASITKKKLGPEV